MTAINSVTILFWDLQHRLDQVTAAKRRHLHTDSDNFLYPSSLFAAEIGQGNKSQIMDLPAPQIIVRHLLKVPSLRWKQT